MTEQGQLEKVAVIFERAGQLQGDKRDAYLEGACSGDASLRAEIESMLQAQAEQGDFLAEPCVTIGAQISENPGAVIDRYKLLQRIGEGGFGVVYMAEQTEPVQRKVALKIIKPGMDTREVVARFEAERQALALMDHPNIAKVLDGGATETGHPFFVMELVKGIPLTEFCDQNLVSTRGRLELFATVCRAIQHAHQKGVIHRDIKPSNVLVTLHDGRPVPKVIDFGVSKAINQKLTEKTMFTSYGQMVGTPQYMSPEQAELSGLDIDTRSDVYSLGVLLYELLTGSTPLETERIRGKAYSEMQRLIRDEEPPRPSTRLSTQGQASATVAAKQGTDLKRLSTLLRGELDWIVMKALEKDRSRRYDTANGLAVDIQRYLDDEPVVARPPSSGYRLRKFARKHRGAFMTGAVIVASLLVGTVVSTWQAVRANQEAARANSAGQLAAKEKAKADQNARQAQSQARRALQEKQQAEASRAAVRRHAYVSDMRLASQAYEEGNLEYVIELLERHWPDPSAGADVRGFEWYHWWQATRLHQQSIRNPSFGPLHKLSVAPNNRAVAVMGWPDSLYVYDTDQQRPLCWPREGASWPWFSPDGAYLFARNNGKIELLDSETFTVARTINPPPDGGNEMLAFSSTQPLAAYAGSWPNARIVLWNLQSWEVEADWDPPGVVRALAFSPDGEAIVTGMNDDTIIAWDVATREVKRTVKQGAKSIVSSPHRGLFAIASNDSVFLCNRELEPLGNPFETSSPVTSLSFSANGDRLAAATSGDNRILVWEVTHQPPTLTLAHTIRGHSRRVGGVAFGSDHNTLWSSGEDGWLKQWDLSRCEPYQTLTHVPQASRVAYSDDGQTLLIIDKSGIAHRWQVAAKASLAPLNPKGEHTGFAVSGSGDVFAGANRNGELEVWDIRSSDVRIKRNSVPANIREFAVAPDGSTIAYFCDGGVDVQDLASGDTKHVPFSAGDRRPVLSADNGKLALHRWNTTQIWNIEANPPALIAEVRGWGGEECSAFSPSGEFLAVGSNGGDIRLHEADTGALKFSLKGHTDPVRSVAFSHDSQSIVSGADDQTVRIWDVESGQLLATFRGHTTAVTSVDFSPAGDSVASCSADGTAIIWTAASQREVNQDVESWLERARYYTNLPNWKRAAEILCEAEKLAAPDSSAVLAMRGYLHGRRGQWESAITDYTQAIELSPNDGELFEQRGNIHAQRCHREEAISDYVKALLLSEELRSRDSFMRMRRSFSQVPLVPKGAAWRYTTDEPPKQWQDVDGFNDSNWQNGAGPFGWSQMTPQPGTPWGRLETDQIWMRHTFQVDREIMAPLALDAIVDDSADVYLNGVLIQRIKKWTGDQYRTFNCPPNVKLRVGSNVLAVHCKNAIDYGKIDVSLRLQDDEQAVAAILAQVLAARPDIEEFHQRREEWQADRDRWKAATVAGDQSH